MKLKFYLQFLFALHSPGSNTLALTVRYSLWKGISFLWISFLEYLQEKASGTAASVGHYRRRKQRSWTSNILSNMQVFCGVIQTSSSSTFSFWEDCLGSYFSCLTGNTLHFTLPSVQANKHRCWRNFPALTGNYSNVFCYIHSCLKGEI